MKYAIIEQYLFCAEVAQAVEQRTENPFLGRKGGTKVAASNEEPREKA